MTLVIQVTDELASALLGASPGLTAARPVLDAARNLGIHLRSQHAASTFFEAEVPDELAERARAALATVPGVLAAYLKPPESLP